MNNHRKHIKAKVVLLAALFAGALPFRQAAFMLTAQEPAESSLVVPKSVPILDTLTLEKSIAMALAESPRLKDRELIDRAGRLTKDNIKVQWYPSLTLNGKVTYQSDVVSLDAPGLPLTLPEMPNEQFGINLDLRQTLYDGGFSSKQNRVESLTTELSMQQVDVDLQKLKEQVTALYFSVVLMEENMNNLELGLMNLEEREKMLSAAVRNGIANETDLAVLKVERLKILQSISELKAARKGVLGMLSVYTGREIPEEVLLDVPLLELSERHAEGRPELALLGKQEALLNASKELIGVKRMPRFYLYGQAGYGMPGYNMLNDQTDTYFLVGAGVTWKIWDWRSASREKQILDTRIDQVSNSRASFEMQLQAGASRELENIAHFREALDMDKEMLDLRKQITAQAATKLENGIISATDYVLLLNEEQMARIRLSTHRMKMIQGIANYNLIYGNL